MTRKSSSKLAMCALAAAVMTTSAEARRIVVDQSEFIGGPEISIDPCQIGADTCTAQTLPFSFDFGSGLTNQYYVYGSGIISFGAPIPGDVDLATTDFSTFGVPVIAPLYRPGESYSVSLVNSPLISGLVPTLPLTGSTTAIKFDEFGDDQVFLLLSGSADQVTFEFFHGYSINPNEVFLPETFGASLGYSIGSNLRVETNPDITGNWAFSIQSASPVPEPSTWAMMLIGFGAIGHTMRRRRKIEARPGCA